MGMLYLLLQEPGHAIGECDLNGHQETAALVGHGLEINRDSSVGSGAWTGAIASSDRFLGKQVLQIDTMRPDTNSSPRFDVYRRNGISGLTTFVILSFSGIFPYSSVRKLWWEFRDLLLSQLQLSGMSSKSIVTFSI